MIIKHNKTANINFISPMERSRARVWRLLFASHTVEWESHHQWWSFPSCPGGSHARPDNAGWGKVFIWISTWEDWKVLGRLHQLTTSVFVPVLLVCLFRFLTVKILSTTFSCVVWWITSTPEWGELNRQNIMTSMAGSCWGRERENDEKILSQSISTTIHNTAAECARQKIFQHSSLSRNRRALFWMPPELHNGQTYTFFQSTLFRPCKCRSNVHIAVDGLAA